MKLFLIYIYSYLRGYKKQLFLVVLGAISVGIATGLIAYIIKPLLDNLFISKNESFLYTLPIILIFIFMLKGFGRFLQGYYSAFIAGKISNKIQINFIQHIMYLDVYTFNKIGSGQIVSRLVSDIDKIKLFLATNMANIIKSITTIIFMLALIILNSPKLAFIALVVVPLIIYPLSIFAKKMKKHSKNAQNKTSLVIHKMNEILNNFEIIKSFSSETKEIQIFTKKTQDFFTHFSKAERTNSLIAPIMEISTSLAIGLTIIIGGQEVINGDMSVGAFFSFMTALIMLYEPIKGLSLDYNRLYESVASYERLQDIFCMSSKIINGSIEQKESIKKVSFKNVSLHYDNICVLKNINIEIAKNDVIAFIGASGSGKSSCVNLISRMYDASDGEVLINNTNIKDLQEKSLRHKIAIVSQRTFLFNDTISNNITYSSKYDEKLLHNAIEQANAQFVYDFKDGVNTVLNESGSNISGGQRQRISIARAIYKNPDIYIFDEATSALDNKSQLFIKQSIKKIAKNKIVILVAHRLSFIDFATKILSFQDGKITSINQGKL